MNSTAFARPLFPLGRTLITPGALELLNQFKRTPSTFLVRHASGDWGTVGTEDAAQNDLAVTNGSRVISAFPVGNAETIWIITEADRSSTTILLPEEY